MSNNSRLPFNNPAPTSSSSSSSASASIFPFLTAGPPPIPPLTPSNPIPSTGNLSARRSLAGHATPPQFASGMNRLPVITRSNRHSTAHSSTTSAQTAATPVMTGRRDASSIGGKPFDPPAYLSFSTCFDQFVTVPKPRELGPGLEPATATSDTTTGTGLGTGTSTIRNGNRTRQSTNPALRLPSPSPQPSSPIPLPTCWAEHDRCNLLDLDSQALKVRFNGTAKYGDRDAAAVRANRPAPPQAGVYYFEVEIKDKGNSGYIGIGFSHAHVRLSRLPGWEDSSWGYHGDDGRAFCCLGTGETFGPTFTTGDVVGCGIDWTDAAPADQRTKEKARDKDSNNKGGARAFFTKNGEFLGYAFANLHGDLYPSVGLRTPGEVVVANFGADPFRFDIESLARARHRTLQSRIASTRIATTLLSPHSPLPTIPALLPPQPRERTHETLQMLIASYLTHHGYVATAHAFENQVTDERIERARGLVPGQGRTEKEDHDDVMRATRMNRIEVGEDGHEMSLRAVSPRTEIKDAFGRGDLDRVIELTNLHFPKVLHQGRGRRESNSRTNASRNKLDPGDGGEPGRSLAEDKVDGEDDGGMLLFKLRLQQFVEAVRRNTASHRTSAGTESNDGKGKARAQATENAHHNDDCDQDMDTNVDSTQSSLDVVLSLGKALHAEYSSDLRPTIQSRLKTTFSLMAYDRPDLEPGEISHLVSDEARLEIADELNSAILISQSLPPIPHLEAMYRHAAASTRLLGELGHGAGVMIHPRDEILGRDTHWD